eukprot:COSAG06_NODE_15203_length_1090_cov_1.235116_1_plen_260_part_01
MFLLAVSMGVVRVAAQASGSGGAAAACPVPGAAPQPPLRASATEHRQLDFTGGYEASAHCEWEIRCEGGQAAALRFTALDTVANINLPQPEVHFVSLYDGGSSESSALLVQLSGSAVPAVPLGARSGELLVVFTSDSSVQRDSFAAEYWCAAMDSLGCTDPAAPNFSPAARAAVDDGSCEAYGGDKAALLAVSRVDPAGRAAWDQLRGWDAAGDVCGWEGVSCDGLGRRVVTVRLSGRTDLRFTLGPALGNLMALRNLRL